VAREKLLLEFWKGGGAGFPSWSALRTESSIYVEYVIPPHSQVVAREYYDLENDPPQLTNLLKDGDPDNDPDTQSLHRELREGRAM
jgi:hypothetical protein